ncbi:proton-conducting transporter membrane subunit [Pyrobaculum sp.]|uniref:proton-conducting transporter transmembrane domain-containing protein n=1 Tax=Pyrobaculum sp. TaxID=2004705 RepID=UPI003170810C
MDPLIYLAVVYTALRLPLSRDYPLDLAYVAVAAALLSLWWGMPYMAPLAAPYAIAIFALRGGKLAPYSGFASAISYTGLGVMALHTGESHLVALGFLMAALAPAVLLPALSDEGSLQGLFRYLIISTLATTMLISGLALREAWPGAGDLLILLAIATELGAAPMFQWVVDVYGRSSAAGLALLASLPKLASAYVLFALRPGLAGVASAFDIGAVATALGALSMLVGNLGALTSRDLRRILAYSTVAHSGFALFIYPLSPQLALAMVLADAVGKMALFHFAERGGARWGTLLMVMNQIGIPPALGFWPKMYIVLTAASAWGPAAGAYVLANIILSVPYYLRVLQITPPGATRFSYLAAALVLAFGLVPPLWIPYILSL